MSRTPGRARRGRIWLAAALCLGAVLGLTSTARAQEAFRLGPQAQPSVELSPHLAYLVDARGQLAPDEAAAADGWVRTTRAGDLSFGYRQGAVWLRTRVENGSERSRDLQLNVGLPQIDRVDVHLTYSDGRRETLRAGDRIRDHERALPDLEPAVPVRLSPGAAVDALIRVESTSSLSLETTIADTEERLREHASSERALGVLFGVLLGLLIYHLAIGFYSRDPGFFWYGAQTVAMLTYVVTVMGIGGRLWSGLDYWAVRAPGIAIALCGASIAHYMRFHLETIGARDRVDRALGIGARIGLGVAAAALLLPPRLGAQLATASVAIVIVVVVAAALLRWSSNVIAARLVLLLWGGIFVLALASSAAALGVGLPVGGTRGLLLYAIIIERLGMALPLGARVRTYMLSEARAREAAVEAEARALEESEERARAELALHERERQLQQSQKLEAVGLLAGGVAHDFNNVLQVVLGCASLLEDDLADRPAARELLEDMVQAARQAAGLTRQLLVFSRKHVMRPESFDLNELVVSMRKMVERAVGSSVKLEIDCRDRPLVVHADRGQLEQALLNLALNAGDAMEDGGTLTIRTARAAGSERPSGPRDSSVDDGYAVLEVEDTGSGMSETLLGFIFEPFFTTKEPGRGTGLGLAMVKAAVERNGGTLEVESEVGRGSTFRLRFPLESARARPAPKAPEDTPSAAAHPARLLLVEDHPQVRALNRRALLDAGFDVIVAGDGDEALALLQAHASELDLVVSDVVIPGTPGWKLILEARTLRPSLPFLLCSGYSPDFVEKRITLDEQTRLLPKPFEQQELVAAVRRMLAMRERIDAGRPGPSAP